MAKDLEIDNIIIIYFIKKINFNWLMENLNINGLNYPLENLSSEARAHLASYQFAEEELIRLNKLVACLQTARNAYFKALN